MRHSQRLSHVQTVAVVIVWRPQPLLCPQTGWRVLAAVAQFHFVHLDVVDVDAALVDIVSPHRGTPFR